VPKLTITRNEAKLLTLEITHADASPASDAEIVLFCDWLTPNPEIDFRQSELTVHGAVLAIALPYLKRSSGPKVSLRLPALLAYCAYTYGGLTRPQAAAKYYPHKYTTASDNMRKEVSRLLKHLQDHNLTIASAEWHDNPTSTAP
jgi:hypothetical protein